MLDSCCAQVHASATETYLTGKALTSPETVKGALAALQGELSPTADPSLASPEYRKSLATCLLYKACGSLSMSCDWAMRLSMEPFLCTLLFYFWCKCRFHSPYV